MSEMEIEMTDDISGELSQMKESILISVVESNGFFRSQQVGEPDLTLAEKRDIATKLLDQNVPLFLERYWKYIKLKDVGYFESFKSYEVNFYLSEIRKFRDDRLNSIQIKNRRYGALKKMIQEGSYFSDAEMKKRNPYLYHQMIFQHLTENERIAAYKEQHKDEKFSSFLLGQMERNVENTLFEEQKNENEAVEEEEDDDDDESSEESELEDEEKSKFVSASEKIRLREEFTNLMYEKFLSGKDSQFDYGSVDHNAEYDPPEKYYDDEEKYFSNESLNES